MLDSGISNWTSKVKAHSAVMRANLFHSYGNEDCFPGRQNELEGSKEKITKPVLRLIEISRFPERTKWAEGTRRPTSWRIIRRSEVLGWETIYHQQPLHHIHIKLLSCLKDFRLWSNENYNTELHLPPLNWKKLFHTILIFDKTDIVFDTLHVTFFLGLRDFLKMTFP